MFFPGKNKKMWKGRKTGSLPILHSRVPKSGERMSLSVSCRGSLTVEAACVLPIFCFSILVFLYFFQAIGTAGRVAEGMQDAGKQMAIYAYIKETAAGSKKSKAEQAVSLLYAKRRIRQAEKDAGISISLRSSSVLDGDEMIDLIAEYRFCWKMPFLDRMELPMLQRARIRAWTGRQETADGGKEKEDTMVYVTVNGSVYHRSRTCTHLRLTVHPVAGSRVHGLRNSDGGKYKPCEECKGANESLVYITDTGDRYHGSVTCRGLKRSVLAVPISQVEGWKECSRCGH